MRSDRKVSTWLTVVPDRLVTQRPGPLVAGQGWRALRATAARLRRDAGVASSNLATPTE